MSKQVRSDKLSGAIFPKKFQVEPRRKSRSGQQSISDPADPKFGRRIDLLTKQLEPTAQQSKQPEHRRKTRSIKSLVMGKVGGVISGRVKHKGKKHSYDKGCDKGSLFNFDVVDTTGEVSVLVLDDQCEALHEEITVGQAYLISNFRVVRSNPRFDISKNGFQIQLMKVIDSYSPYHFR